MESINFNVGDKIPAYITYLGFKAFESPIFVYVQPSELSLKLDLVTELIEKIVAETDKETFKEHSEGDFCLALYDEDNTWYRGEVVGVGGSTLKVYFFDYGNTEVIDKTNIRSLPENLRDIPPLAVKCNLNDFKDGIADEKEKQVLEDQFLNNEFDLEVVNLISLKEMNVSLFTKDSKKLKLQTFFERKSIQNVDEVLKEDAPEMAPAIKLTSGLCYSAYISHIDEPSDCNRFYIQLVSDESYLNDLMSKLSDYCGKSQQKLHEVKSGAVCCTKFSEDDAWYRARILQLGTSNNNVSVQFIDYGNRETKQTSELYLLPRELASLPSLCIPCIYDNSHHIPDITDKLDEVCNAGSVGCYILAHQSDGCVNVCLKEVQDLSPVMVESQFSPLTIDVGDTVDCCISHVNGDGSFYIQLLRNVDELDNMMETIEVTQCELPQLCDPLVGCPCVCKLSDEAFYRCEIINSDQETIEVRAVDFGFTESVHVSSVKAISGEIFDSTLLCVRCILSDSKLSPITPSSCHVPFLERYEGAHPVVAKVLGEDGSSLLVCMYDTQNGKDVNFAAEVIAFSKIKSPVILESKVHVNEVVRIDLPTLSPGATITVCVTAIKSNNIFYGQIVKDSIEVIGQLQTDINKCYDNMSPSDSKLSSSCKMDVGDFCITKYSLDGGWYRGVITEISGSNADVMFIDFGDSEKVALTELKVVKSQFSSLTQQCIVCKINPDVVLSKDLLTRILVDKRVELKIQSVGGTYNPFGVELTDNFKNKPVKDGLFGSSKQAGFGKPAGSTFQERSFGKRDEAFQSKGGFGEAKDRSFVQKDSGSKPGFGGGFGGAKPKAFGDEDAKKPSGFGGFGGQKPKEDEGSQSGFGQQERSGPRAGFGANREKSFERKDGFGGLTKEGNRGRDSRLSGDEKHTGFKVRDISDYQPPAITVPSTETIFISHVETPDLFQCQLNSTSKQLNQLMGSIGTYYNALSSDEDVLPTVMLGQSCIAQYSADKQWYRAQITGILANGLVEVLFVDFGNTEVVPQCNLKIIKEEFLKLSVHCVQCGLAGVSPSLGYWSPEHIAQFEDMVLEQSFKATFDSQKRDEPHYAITLYDSSNNVINLKFASNTSTTNQNVNIEATDLRTKLNRVRGGIQDEKLSCGAAGDGFGVSSVNPVISKPRFGGGDSSDRTSGFGGRMREIPQLPKSLSKSNEDSWDDSGSPAQQKFDKLASLKDGSRTEPSNNIQGSYKSLKLMTGEKLDVCVVYALKPNEFYCQLIRSCSELKDLLDELNTEYSLIGRNDLNISRPAKGMPCAAKFVEDETWYRGIIESVQADCCGVKFVDYGNSEQIAMGSLKQLKAEFLSLPIQGIRCGIANIKSSSEEWTEKASADFEELTLDKHLVIKLFTISADGSHIVELRDTSNNTDFALKLIELGHALSCSSISSRFRGAAISCKGDVPLKSPPRADASIVKGVGKSPFKPFKIEPGLETLVFVSWVESPESFWCQLADDPSGLDELVEAIQAHYTVGGGAKKVVKSAHIGMAIVAPYSEDEAWYRAYVEKMDDKLTVRFVDFGNTDVVDVQSVREVSPDFIDIPSQAVKCSLPGLKPKQQGKWISDAKDILEDIVKDGAYCKFLSEKDGVFSVRLTVEKQNVAEELVKAAVAAYSTDLSPPPPSQKMNDNIAPRLLQTDNTLKSDTFSREVRSDSQNVSIQQKLPLKLLSYQNSKPLSAGQTVPVIVVHCETINRLWCQLSPSTDLGTLMDELEENYGSSAFENLKPVVKMPCIAKYSEDQGWYRGEVVTVKDGSCLVHFIDYGNSSDVHLSDMREIKEIFMSLPKQAFECSLPRLSDVSDNKEYLENIVLEQEMTLKVLKSGKVNDVDLFIGNDSVSEMVLHKLHPKSMEPSYSKEKDFPERNISVGHKEMVYTVLITSPGQVYLHLTSLTTELDHITQQLQTECSHSQSLPSVDIGIICCAKFSEDGCWYRAKVIDMKDLEIVVQFVDYGNCARVTKDQLKCLSLKFASIPPFAVEVNLSEIEPIGESWTPDATKFLESLCVEKDLMCSFITENSVELKNGENDVGKQLIAAGHAKKVGSANIHPSVNRSEKKTINVPAQTFEPGQIEDAFISHYDSPSKFFVHLTRLEDAIDKMSAQLQEIMCEEANDTFSEPQVGQFCCAKYSVDDSWYRAQIKDITSTGITVTFIDFGNSEILDKTNLKSLTPTLLAPSFAVECTLSGISPVSGQVWTEDACNCFQNLTEDQDIKCKFLTGNLVELTVSDECIAQKLVSAGHASYSEKMSQFPKQNIPLNENVNAYISVVENPNNFYIHLKSKSSEIDKYVANLQLSYKDLAEDNLKFESGELCVAKYSEDESWYRAIIQSVDGENVTVLFVDFGNIETMSKNELRRLSTEFSSEPPFAINCSLLNLGPRSGEWTREACTYFESLLGEEFVCNFCSENIVRLIIDGEDVSEKLIFEGHALRAMQNTLSTTDFPEPDISVGEQVSVQICHIDSPTQFYVHQNSHNQELQTLCEKLVSPMTKCLSTVDTGSMCLASSSETELWCRGRILSINDDKTATVYLVDSGKSFVCDISKLKEIDDELKQIPPFAIKCGLSDLQGKEDWTIDDNRLFESLVKGKNLTSLFVKRDEVRLTVDGNDIAEQFLLMSQPREEVVVPSESAFQECVNIPETKQSEERSQGPEKDLQLQSDDELFENATDDIAPNALQNETKNAETEQLKFKRKNMVKGQRLKVTVTHVNSPSQFWIQLDSAKTLINAMMEELYEYYNGLSEDEMTSTDFYSGMPCAVFYELDESWYRAEVKNIEEENIEVLFVDYGNTETVGKSMTRTLSDRFVEHPCQVVECFLGGVKRQSGLWNDESTLLFNELTSDKSLLADIVDVGVDGICQVHLLHLGMSISEKLLSSSEGLEAATPVKLPQTVKRIFSDGETATPLAAKLTNGLDMDTKLDMSESCTESEPRIGTETETLEVVVSCVIDPTDFWCQRVSTVDKVKQLAQELAVANLESLKSFDIGDLCVASLDNQNKRVRAKIERIEEESILIHFLDYGNSGTSSKEQIFKMPAEHSVLPAQAIHCSLELQPKSPSSCWSDEAIAMFSDLIRDKSLKLKIVSKDSEKWITELLCDDDVNVSKCLLDGNVAEFKEINDEFYDAEDDSELNTDTLAVTSGMSLLETTTEDFLSQSNKEVEEDKIVNENIENVKESADTDTSITEKTDEDAYKSAETDQTDNDEDETEYSEDERETCNGQKSEVPALTNEQKVSDKDGEITNVIGESDKDSEVVGTDDIDGVYSTISMVQSQKSADTDQTGNDIDEEEDEGKTCNLEKNGLQSIETALTNELNRSDKDIEKTNVADKSDRDSEVVGTDDIDGMFSAIQTVQYQNESASQQADNLVEKLDIDEKLDVKLEVDTEASKIEYLDNEKQQLLEGTLFSDAKTKETVEISDTSVETSEERQDLDIECPPEIIAQTDVVKVVSQHSEDNKVYETKMSDSVGRDILSKQPDQELIENEVSEFNESVNVDQSINISHMSEPISPIPDTTLDSSATLECSVMSTNISIVDAGEGSAYNRLRIECDSEIPVTVVFGRSTSPSGFSMQLLSMKMKRDSMLDMLDEYVQEFVPDDKITFSDGDPCLVHDAAEEWHRAEIIKVIGDKFQVELVDYGEIMEVPRDKLHSIPDDLMILPAQVILGKLIDCYPSSKKWTQEALDYFKDYCSEKDLIAYFDVTSCSCEEVYEVSIGELHVSGNSEFSLSEEMVNRGFAQAFPGPHLEENVELDFTHELEVSFQEVASHRQDSFGETTDDENEESLNESKDTVEHDDAGDKLHKLSDVELDIEDASEKKDENQNTKEERKCIEELCVEQAKKIIDDSLTMLDSREKGLTGIDNKVNVGDERAADTISCDDEKNEPNAVLTDDSMEADRNDIIESERDEENLNAVEKEIDADSQLTGVTNETCDTVKESVTDTEESIPKNEDSKQLSLPQLASTNEDDSSKHETNEDDSSKRQTHEDDSSKRETNEDDCFNCETNEDDSSKRETNEDDSFKRETNKDDSSKRETNEDDSSKRETNEDDSSKQETNEDDSSERETNENDSSRRESEDIAASITKDLVEVATGICDSPDAEQSDEDK